MKIVDIKFVKHMALESEHSLLQTGIVKAKENIIHNKEVVIETHTKRNKASGKFGKQTTWYYLNEDGSPEFDSFQKFRNYYMREFIA